MTRRLKDKVAIVTGASRGIGAAIAMRLAKEGAHVAITYHASRDKASILVKQLEKEGVKAIAIQADHSDSRAVESAITTIGETFGKIDILINNAGIFVSGKIDDPSLDIAGLDRQMAINLTSVVVATRATMPYMGSGGRIVLIGSINGERSPGSGFADYSATKAALLGYTHGWARDLGSKNITVNLLQPGPINTDMNPEDSDFARDIVKTVPLGRYGQPEEIAGAVAFLVGPDASYISGTVLTVDGGFLA